jgi:hypothetical protein
MVKEKEIQTCGHCDYTSEYKIAVIAHERKHKNEPVPKVPVVKAETPPKEEVEAGLIGPGEETDDTPGISNPQAGRFN